MNCCICGPVKNCGPYLRKVLENIEKIGSLFDDYSIIIYYDNSTDNTLEILKEYQLKNKLAQKRGSENADLFFFHIKCLI